MPSKKTLCREFLTLSVSTWERLRIARRVGFPIAEDTITDLNLLTLFAKQGPSLFTIKFSRRQEAVTGADWEWWMRGSARLGFGFRVQAKCLHPKTTTYRYLHDKDPKTGIFQCEQLISDALRTPGLAPVYCLYSNWDLRRHCRGRNWTGERRRRPFGCAMVSAFVIRRLRRGNVKDLASIWPMMSPLHHLVCPPGPKRPTVHDLPQRGHQGWQRLQTLPLLFPPHETAQNTDGEETQPVQQATGSEIAPARAPRWVEALEAGREPEWPDDRVGGLVVISESSNQPD